MIQPEWVYRLIHGLTTYSDEHPKLYAQFYPTYDYQPADCPCRLVELVPEDIRRDAFVFMEGVRTAEAKAETQSVPTGEDAVRDWMTNVHQAVGDDPEVLSAALIAASREPFVPEGETGQFIERGERG